MEKKCETQSPPPAVHTGGMWVCLHLCVPPCMCLCVCVCCVLFWVGGWCVTAYVSVRAILRCCTCACVCVHWGNAYDTCVCRRESPRHGAERFSASSSASIASASCPFRLTVGSTVAAIVACSFSRSRCRRISSSNSLVPAAPRGPGHRKLQHGRELISTLTLL